MNVSIDATAGARQYNLPNNIHGIISVEYQPGGSSTEPPAYFKLHDHMLDDFYTTDEVYDWLKLDNSASASAPSTILVNPETPADADTYSIEYTADHAALSSGADVLTVPDRHINLIYLYVRWCAIQELSTGVKRNTYISPAVAARCSSPTPRST